MILVACGVGFAGTNVNPEWLVTPEWLKTQLGNASLILVDTRSDDDYAEGHIPGSIQLDLSDLNSKTTETDLLQFRNEVARRFATLGYGGSERVVFYDEGAGTRAPRAFWDFVYVGGKKGSLLAGGMTAWKKANGRLSWDRSARLLKPFPLKEAPEVLATVEYVARRQHDSTTVILDVRSQGEYNGAGQSNSSGRLGHIPGAKWLEWTELLDQDHQFLPVAQLQQKLFQAGITPDKEVIVYCRHGNRASNTYWALRLLGFPKVRNYIGAWQEWAARLDLPVERVAAATVSEMPGK
jgi:thiosulfate/3-mercaptopyruvate sulfurtransferase